MKRLFKMLSLLSILLILGSCDSSKAINISAVKGVKQYVKFKSLNSTTYPVIYISVVKGSGVPDYKFIGDEYEVERNTSYIVQWQYKDTTDNNNLKTVVKTDVFFNFQDSTVLISLGNSVNAWLPEKY